MNDTPVAREHASLRDRDDLAKRCDAILKGHCPGSLRHGMRLHRSSTAAPSAQPGRGPAPAIALTWALHLRVGPLAGARQEALRNYRRTGQNAHGPQRNGWV
jgi:hypothetical protein